MLRHLHKILALGLVPLATLASAPQALAADDFPSSRFAPQEVEPFPASSADFTAVMHAENPIWLDLVKKNNLRAQ